MLPRPAVVSFFSPKINDILACMVPKKEFSVLEFNNAIRRV